MTWFWSACRVVWRSSSAREAARARPLCRAATVALAAQKPSTPRPTTVAHRRKGWAFRRKRPHQVGLRPCDGLQGGE